MIVAYSGVVPRGRSFLCGDPRAFEIKFPKTFVFGMKAMQFLPYSLYFWIWKRMTKRA